MKYQIHVTYTDGKISIIDYDGLPMFRWACTDWADRIGRDVKVFAAYVNPY